MSKKTVLPYLAAFTVALIGAAVAMGGVAITYLAQENPKLAAILGAGYAVMLGFSKVLPTPDAIVHPAQVSAENVEQMTVNPPAAEPPVSAAMLPFPATEPPAVNVTARLPRTKSGRFERTGTPKPPAPDPAFDAVEHQRLTT